MKKVLVENLEKALVKRVMSITIILIITILGFIAMSYSYYTIKITDTEKSASIFIMSGDKTIVYTSIGELSVSEIVPGNDVIIEKTFTLTGNNSSEETISYHLSLVIDGNNFPSNLLKYTLASENIGNSGLIVPAIIEAQGIAMGVNTILLGTGGFAPGIGKVHSYILRIYFPENDLNPSEYQDKTFMAHILITNDNGEKIPSIDEVVCPPNENSDNPSDNNSQVAQIIGMSTITDPQSGIKPSNLKKYDYWVILDYVSKDGKLFLGAAAGHAYQERPSTKSEEYTAVNQWDIYYVSESGGTANGSITLKEGGIDTVINLIESSSQPSNISTPSSPGKGYNRWYLIDYISKSGKLVVGAVVGHAYIEEVCQSSTWGICQEWGLTDGRALDQWDIYYVAGATNVIELAGGVEEIISFTQTSTCPVQISYSSKRKYDSWITINYKSKTGKVVLGYVIGHANQKDDGTTKEANWVSISEWDVFTNIKTEMDLNSFIFEES